MPLSIARSSWRRALVVDERYTLVYIWSVPIPLTSRTLRTNGIEASLKAHIAALYPGALPIAPAANANVAAADNAVL
jgi:hypothetical protein